MHDFIEMFAEKIIINCVQNNGICMYGSLMYEYQVYSWHPFPFYVEKHRKSQIVNELVHWNDWIFSTMFYYY